MDKSFNKISGFMVNGLASEQEPNSTWTDKCPASSPVFNDAASSSGTSSSSVEPPPGFQHYSSSFFQQHHDTDLDSDELDDDDEQLDYEEQQVITTEVVHQFVNNGLGNVTPPQPNNNDIAFHHSYTQIQKELHDAFACLVKQTPPELTKKLFETVHRPEDSRVSIKSSEWVRENSCKSALCASRQHLRMQFCQAFSLDDYQNRFHGNKMDGGFYYNIKQCAESVVSMLALFPTISKREQSIMNNQIRANPYVLYILRMHDSELMYLKFDTDLLQRMLQIRIKYGINGNEYIKSVLYGFKAQGLSDGFCVLSGMLSNMYQTFVGWWNDATEIGGGMLKVVSHVLDWFKDKLSWAASIPSSILTMISEIFTKIYQTILFQEYLVPVFETLKPFLAPIFYMTSVMLVVKLGLIAFERAYDIICCAFGYATHNTCFVSQGPIDAVTGIITMTGMAFGLYNNSTGGSHSTIRILRDYCGYIAGLVAAGTAITKVVDFIFCLLPATLQVFLLSKFGSTNQKAEFLLSRWQAKVIPAISIADVSGVCSTKHYEEILFKLVAEGKEVLQVLPHSDLKANAISLFSTVLNLYRTCKSNIAANKPRSEPFSFHLCGFAGVGKSTIVTRLLNDAFNYDVNSIFYRTSGDPFWSKAGDPKVVVMDEFLLGSPDSVCSQVIDYLGIVSSIPFKPAQPGLNEKGSNIAPEVVVTINNSIYETAEGFSNDALDRRRHAVILVILCDEFFFKSDTGLMQPMTPSMIIDKIGEDKFSDFEHLRFCMLNPYRRAQRSMASDTTQVVNAFKPTPGNCVKYDIMKKYLQSLFAERNKHRAMMKKTFGIDSNPMTVNELYEDSKRTFARLPRTGFGLIDSIKHLLGVDKVRQFNMAPGLLQEERDLQTDLAEFIAQGSRYDSWSMPTNSRRKNKRSSDQELATPIGKRNILHTIDTCYPLFLSQMRQTNDYDSAVSTLISIVGSGYVGTDTFRRDLVSKIRCMKLVSGHDTDLDEMLAKIEGSSNVIKPSDDTQAELQKETTTSIASTSRSTSESESSESPAVLDDGNHQRQHAQESDDGASEHYADTAEPELVIEHPELLERVNLRYRGDNRYYVPFSAPMGIGVNSGICKTIHEYLVSSYDFIKRNGEYYWKYMTGFTAYLGDRVVVGFGKGISSVVTAITAAVVVYLGSYVVSRLFNSFCSKEEKTEQPIHFVNQSNVFGGPGGRMRNILGNRVRQQLKAVKGLSRNVYNAHGPTANNPDMAYLTAGQVVIRMIPIEKNIACTYTHGLQSLLAHLSGQELAARTNNPTYSPALVNSTLNYSGKSYPVFVSEKHCYSFENSDITFIVFPNSSLPSFRSNRKRFIDDSALGVLEEANFCGRFSDATIYTKAVISHDHTYDLNDGTTQHLSDCWLYTADTKAGDCGTPLIMTSPFTNKIIGMHVAGSRNESMGLGVIITAGDVEQMLTVISGDQRQGMIAEGPINTKAYKPVRTPEQCEVVREDILSRNLPNVVDLEIIPHSERFHLSTMSKIIPSALHGEIGYPVNKGPPVLHKDDPRCNGTDPVDLFLETVGSIKHPNLDEDLLNVVYKETFERVNSDLVWPIGKRMLQPGEALFGIPGLLRGLDYQTSAGYPLGLGRMDGKRSFFWYENQTPVISPEYQATFNQYRKRIEDNVRNGNERKLHKIAHEHRFVGFLKDELRTSKNISISKTRLIFANDLRFNHLMRMYYGCLFVAVNNSGGSSFFACGLNPYSNDFDCFVRYLKQTGASQYIAGDYKGFDMHMHPEFRMRAYQIIADLLPNVPDLIHRFMYEHECETPCQVGPYILNTKCNHMSGCFFTTIVNCLVNDMMIRYCFYKLHPEHLFDEKVRAVYLGDDHILSVKDAPNFTPLNLKTELELIGQEYTAADKESEITHEYSTLETLTFLGAHPVRGKDGYYGRLKKETIQESLQWMRKNDAIDFKQNLITMLEFASLWGDEYYNNLFRVIDDTLVKKGRLELRVAYKPPDGVRMRVISRTVATGYNFIVQGNEKINLDKFSSDLKAYPRFLSSFRPKFVAQGDRVDGLTQLTTHKIGKTVNRSSKNKTRTIKQTLGRPKMEMEFGIESNVFRQTVDWTLVSTSNLYSVDVPWGLLNSNNTINLQNMPFSNFIYYTTDVEITFLVNGTPFQAGYAVAWFRPLHTSTNNQSNDLTLTTLPHVILRPNCNVASTLTIPFLWFRQCMNTYAGELGQESLGVITITVLSPLTSVTPNDKCTITIFSKFVQSNFAIPRPSAASGYAKQLGISDFVAQGGGMSTLNYYNDFSLASAAGVGNLPPITINQNGTNTSSGASLDFDIPISVPPIPLDNPPISGGFLNVGVTYPGLSKNSGAKHTRTLGYKHDVMNINHFYAHDPTETNIEALCRRECIFTKLDWNTTQLEGTQLMKVDLNSMLTQGISANYTSGLNNIPFNLGLLNVFRFWRCDFVFKFKCIRTSFHSGRLLATVGYGAPASAVTPANRNQYYNEVLTFDGEDYIANVRVPYQSANQYLNIYRGGNFVNYVQDQSLGTLLLTVQNQLRATATVSNTVQVLVFISLENVEVYEVNPANFVYFNDYTTGNITTMTQLFAAPAQAKEEYTDKVDISDSRSADTALRASMQKKKATFVAQGPTTTVTQVSEKDPEDVPREQQVITESLPLQHANQPYKDNIHAKFPYVVKDLTEIFRRYTRLDTSLFLQYDGGVNSEKFYVIPVTWIHRMGALYAGWAGSLHYRIGVDESSTIKNVGFFHSTEVWARNQVCTVNPITGLEGDFADLGIAKFLRNKMTAGSPVTVTIPRNVGAGGWNITSADIFKPMNAVEKLDPQNSFTSWIDVRIPFDTIFEFLPTVYTTSLATNMSIDPATAGFKAGISPLVGYMVVNVETSMADSSKKFDVFQSVGDDFRLYGFRAAPARYCPYYTAFPSNGTTSVVNNFASSLTQ